jgi:hypothetical protein
MWKFARYTYDLRYELGVADALEFFDFFEAHYGANTAFDFVDPMVRGWDRVFVGVGDGTTTTFNLPYWVVASRTDTPVVYVNASVQTYSTHYVLNYYAGENFRTKLTFQAGAIPTAGQLITADIAGRRVHTVKFLEDSLKYTVTSKLADGNDPVWTFDFTLVSQRGTA